MKGSIWLYSGVGRVAGIIFEIVIQILPTRFFFPSSFRFVYMYFGLQQQTKDWI
jgi:hypothetical protein